MTLLVILVKKYNRGGKANQRRPLAVSRLLIQAQQTKDPHPFTKRKTQKAPSHPTQATGVRGLNNHDNLQQRVIAVENRTFRNTRVWV